MAEVHEATEGSFSVGRRCVEEDARHGFAGAAGLAAVDAFADGRGGVSALEGELVDEGVREGVEQHVALPVPSAGWVEVATLPPTLLRTVEGVHALGASYSGFPVGDGVFG